MILLYTASDWRGAADSLSTGRFLVHQIDKLFCCIRYDEGILRRSAPDVEEFDLADCLLTQHASPEALSPPPASAYGEGTAVEHADGALP